MFRPAFPIHADHPQQWLAILRLLYRQVMAGQCVLLGTLEHLELEAAVLAFRARFLEQGRHGDGETALPACLRATR